MEADRFDALLRSLASRTSRRAFSNLTIAGSLAAVLGHAPEVVSKKRKKKKCKGGTTKCGKACVNTQTDPAHCGGCNQACAGGATCRNGSCQTTTTTTTTGPGNCTPACAADRTCFMGVCLCNSHSQCVRDKDPGGEWCIKPTGGDPLKTHCGCQGNETVCAAGEKCSNCCDDAACLLIDPSMVCPFVPAGVYRGRFCCVDNGQACDGHNDCCSNLCNFQAGTCACRTAGQTCTYNNGCCSGNCSSLTGTCV